jgi:hypothetical protein
MLLGVSPIVNGIVRLVYWRSEDRIAGGRFPEPVRRSDSRCPGGTSFSVKDLVEDSPPAAKLAATERVDSAAIAEDPGG